MPKFLNNINLEAANDIQFKTTAGANAGKIEQDGNNLVLSNAVGDVLLGDGSSDVYIGDGTNNVDILFEQSGSIKGDGSAVTLTIGGANTTLNLENPNINGAFSIGTTSINNKLTFTTANGYILFDHEPSGDTGAYEGTTSVPLLKIDTGGTEKSILERVSEQGGILLGADDSVIIAAGDTRNTLRSNLNEAEEKVIFASEGGFHAYGFPSNNTTWSNRNEFRFRSDSATASDNGLYIGEGTNVQFIDLSRNLKNIGTIGSAAITSTGSVTATSFIKSGGTTNQFLKADGSVDSNTYATQSYVSTQVSNLVDSAPTTLDTLNELATALGDDASFSTTMSTSLGNRLRVDTASQGLNSTQKSNARTNLGLGTAATSASTAFATAAQGTSAENALPKAGGTMTGALNTGANAFGGTYLSINSGGVTQWGASRGILTWDTNWASIYATSGKELRLGAGGGNDNSIILDGSTVEINKDITTTGTVTATGGNSTNWNTAYTDRNKWDGGSTGLTASTGRTSLGLGSAATQNTSAFATAAQGTSAETAYGWGDHSGAGYLTSSSTQSKYLRSDASDSFSGKLTGTATNENLEVGGIRGTAKGSQTGDYIHLYERVHIGGPSGWGHSTHGAPSNGLSVWGAIDLGMGGSGALQVDGTTVLTNARVLQNVTAAAGIITSGTFADARIPSLAASKITSGNLDNARMPTHVDIGGKLDIGVSTNYGTTTNADKLWIASFNTGQSDVPGSYYDIINLSSNSAHGIQIASNFGASSGAIYMRTRSDNAAAPAGSGLQAWNKIWHHNNDGTGSGLDADLLDAQEGSYYRNATNLNAGTVAADRLSTASTQPPNDNSTKIATTAYVQTELTDLIGAAPAALDTLSELADAINDDSTFSSTVTTALGNRLRVDTASQGLNSTQKSNARTNLGLGTAATSASTAFAPAAGSTSIVSLGTVVAGDWNAGVISSTYLDADTAHLSGTQTFSGAKTFSSTGNTFNGHHYFSAYNSAGNHYPHYMHGSTGGAKVNVRVYNTGGGSADVLYFAAGDNNMTWRGNKIWNAGNDGAGTGLDADLLDGNHASAFMGSSGMAANTDVYMNFRVLRNSNSSSANDGMYIGYGNSNSGQTRIFGGGSTGVHLAINATNMAFNNNAVWHAGNDGSGSGLDADKLDGVDGVVLAQSLRAGLNVTGGGTITVDASYYIKNSSRFIVISAGRGSNFATDGYFDIDIPTSGTITGVGGASNKTATSNGIPLASWEALYYILPLGSAATSQAANFKVVRYTSGFDIPYNWVLLAVRNSDGTNQVSILGGKYILGAGQSINTQSYNSRRIEFADKLTTARTIAGTSFNGSANIDISYNNLTNKPTIPSLSGYATQSYVGTQISNLIDSSPAALNTLNELAAALGDDANFSTTITDSIATKAPLASPTFTGAVTLSGSIQNNNQATSIDLKDHSNYTWFRNAANRWVFQGGADGDDWTQHFALKLETVGTGYNDKYAELGQQQNNGSNGGRYKGVRIVKSTGSSSVVDGELKAGDGVFSGSVTGSNLNISNWNTAHGWGNHASAGYVTSSGNTIIGTDSDIDTSGATVIDQLNMTDGVIQSHSTRTLTLANLGYTGATNANNYSLPEATATARGGIELFSNTDQSVAANSVSATSGRTYGIQLNSAGQAVVNVPWSDTNTDTNTTYSAGNGISLSSTTFSVAAGGGLTQTSTGLSHSDTSSQASVNNSSGTVIQDITLDTYGHITAISSANLDGRYYTETETNSFLNLKANLNGATFTGDLTVSKTSPLIRIYDSNTGSGSYPALEFDTANNQGVAIEFNEFDGELPAGGYGLIIKESSTNAQFPTTGTLSLSVLGEIYAGSTSIGSVNRVFHDGYHPNADTLTTARTINGVSFNGSSNITVADSTKLPLSGGTVTGNVTFNSNINVGERVTHNGDSNTWMGMTTDQINFYAGNVKMLTLQEGTHDQIVINENGGDVNFRIESDLESNAFYIDGAGNGSVGILTTTPTATLDVDGTIEHKVYTVSTLPSASPAGKRAFVSDAYYDLASSHGSTFPGGGSYTIPCYSDGSNWRAG